MTHQKLIYKTFLIVISILIFGGYAWFFKPLKPENVLIVGTCSGFPPYELMDEQGTIIGFDIDVAHYLAQGMNKKLVIEDMSFDALMVALQQGKIDMALAGISITKSRQQEIELIHYTGQALTSLPLVFWKEIPPTIKTIEDLQNQGATICVQTGTLQQEIMSSFQGLNLKNLENISDLIIDIKFGKAVAAVLEPPVALALQLQYPELQILHMPLQQAQQDAGTGIAINKNNKELIAIVCSLVNQLKNDGTLERLHTKWFGKGVNNDTQ